MLYSCKILHLFDSSDSNLWIFFYVEFFLCCLLLATEFSSLFLLLYSFLLASLYFSSPSLLSFFWWFWSHLCSPFFFFSIIFSFCTKLLFYRWWFNLLPNSHIFWKLITLSLLLSIAMFSSHNLLCSRVQVKNLSADKDMVQLAASIVEKCKYVHPSRAEEIEQVWYLT